MKPACWRDVPWCIVENFIWDLYLDYDPYESSKAETIHQISCGNVSGVNNKIISSAWAVYSEESFKTAVINNLEILKREVQELEKYIA